MPTVRRPGCFSRRGTSRDAGSRNVKLPIVELGIAPELGQIAAHQRQVVLVIDLSQRANALRGLRIADPATQRITGVRRISDHPATAYDRRGLANQARLRIDGVNRKILSHEVQGSSPRPRRPSLYNPPLF